MNVRLILSVAAVISAIALPSTAFAQTEHMISGKAVPASEVAAVQAKCNDLHKEAMARAEKMEPKSEEKMESKSQEKMESKSEEKMEAKPAEKMEAKPAEHKGTTPGWSADGKIDFAQLTVKLCDEAKFTAPAK